jgi:RNA polymerase sigma-70 factor (ECF subfamily)
VPDGAASNELDSWVLATAPRAVAYARSLLRNPHDAEDIVQDCYLRLLAKADAYDLPQDGLKLLLASVTNASINLRTRRKPMFGFFRSDDDTTEEPEDAAAIAPVEISAGMELNEALAAALGHLPKPQRAAVELKALGYSQNEIAEMLGLTQTNAGVLIHRGRKALEVLLAKFLPVES